MNTVLSLIQKNRRLIAILILLMIIIATFVPTSYSLGLTSDGQWYVSSARNIVDGNGYSNEDLTPIYSRGPAYPFYLAAGMQVLGDTPFSIFLLNRVWYLLCILFIFALGRDLFNLKVGLGGALFVLATPIFAHWFTFIHLDHIVAALNIGFLWLLYRVKADFAWYWFVGLGVFLGITYLVKELVILFSWLPIFLLFDTRISLKSRLRNVLIIYGVALLIVAPWTIYIRFVLENSASFHIETVSNNLSSVVQEEVSGIRRYLNLVSDYFAAIGAFYRQYLVANFSYAYLLVAASVFVCIRASFTRERQYLYLSAALLSYMPMVVFQGLFGFRPRQSFTLFLLMYVALAVSIIEIINIGSFYLDDRQRPELRNSVAFISIGIFALMTGIWGVDQTKHKLDLPDFVRDNNLISHLWVSNESANWQYPPDERFQSFVDTTLELSPDGTTLVSDWIRPIFFYSEAALPGYRVPVRIETWELDRSENTGSNLLLGNGSWAGVGSSFADYPLYANNDADLVWIIERENVEYVVAWYAQIPYFLDHPGYEIVEVQPGYFLFKVVDPYIIQDYQPILPAKTMVFFETIQLEHSERVPLLSEYMRNELGMSERQITLLFSGELFELDSNYHIMRNYYRMYREYEHVDVQNAIAAYKTQIELNPSNDLNYLIIAALYSIAGDTESSHRNLELAIQQSSLAESFLHILQETQLSVPEFTLSGESLELLAGTLEERAIADSNNKQLLYRYIEFWHQNQLHSNLVSWYESEAANLQFSLSKEVLEQIGDAYLATDRLEDAVDLYEAALDKGNANKLMYRQLAELYSKTSANAYEDQLRMYEKLVEIAPNRKNVHIDLARFLLETE